ncbi:MAG: HlyD family efflux transporter periplasmic adaptor subunit [Pseudohongiella sp.]|nr:HlyD family efflux transporter periplasmic adaptor subunit [Pseudohongiella sp.]
MSIALPNQAASAALPPLRDELNVFPGAPTLDGAPSWVLQDPVSHKFFRIGWREHEILARWHLGKSDVILKDIKEHSLLDVSASHIDALLKFLSVHSLLQSRGPQAIARLKEQHDKAQKRDITWLIKNYLFVRIPLVRPDQFLSKTLPYVRWMGSRQFLVFTLVCALLGVYLAQRNWNGFLSQFPYFFSLQGLILMGITLSIAKILHELGHAYTCKHFGCRVPSMGVALLVMWPVLYTDATDSWRLTSRRQRLIISAAGMATELALAAFATLLWSFLPDGALRSSLFLLATTTWIVTLFINLNPFMRFDGYYLLSDLLGIPNLQDRAFAIARWRMREALFGFGDDVPEQFSSRTQTLLLIYSYGTWIYRFFLFLGIALLVYFLFFKLLGIFLMFVELVWFIGRPLYTEVKHWLERRPEMSWNKATKRSALLAGLLLALLIFPWQRDIAAPALWQTGQHSHLYSPSPAQIERILLQPGSSVTAGEPIMQLVSPDLDYEIKQGETTLAMLDWQTQFQSVSNQLQERAPIAWQELEVETASQQARLEERNKLTILSPVDGIVRELPAMLSEGEWVAANEWLGIVVAPELAMIEAYVSEAELGRLPADARARFFPDDLSLPAFEVTLLNINTASTRQLSEAYLASTQGGPIAVREDTDAQLVPEQPVYLVRAAPLEERAAPGQITRGTLHIQGSRESPLQQIWRTVVAVLIRESGF